MDLHILLSIFSFITGTVVGSFLNVCIYRLPREESIVFPASRCTSCNKHIPFYYNIPLISYLFLRGKCFNCKQHISIDYFLVEFISGLLTLFIYIKFGLTIHFLFIFILIMSLIVVTFIDLEHMIIPDVITYPGIAVGILYNVLMTDFNYAGLLLENASYNILYLLYMFDEIKILNSLMGAIIGGGSLLLLGFMYKKIRHADGLGLGDVKLLAMIGAFLGWRSIIFVALLSSLIGTIIGLALVINRKGNLKYAIPYGPFLSFAAVVYCFVGDLTIDYFYK